MTLVPLGLGLDPGQVGPKFANLARAACFAPVPQAVCIPVGWHRRAVGAETLRLLTALTGDLRATAAFGLPDVAREVDRVLAAAAVPAELRALLGRELQDGFSGDRLAVRSSAITEDSAHASYAGVYESVIDIGGLDDVCAAVGHCWRSYYSSRALAARLRHGDDLATPGMAVIIQRLVPATRAGVAISDHSGEVLVEFVRGPAGALVAGETDGIRVRGADLDRLAGKDRLVVGQVVKLTRELAATTGAPVDVEWASAVGEVQIVQVRAVATAAAISGGTVADVHGSPADPALVEAVPLYAERLPDGTRLGECREIYMHFVTKRRWARAAAERAGLHTGAAWVVNLTWRGLAEHADRLERQLATDADRVVLDLSPAIRQVILDKPDLVRYLRETLPQDRMVHALLIRDFHAGAGAISTVRQGGAREVVIEYAEKGLLAMNRGLTDGHCFVVPHETVDRRAELDRMDTVASPLARSWPAIEALTRELDATMPGIHVEWVVEDSRVSFVDYSPVRGLLPSKLAQPGATSMVLSDGDARGPAVVVDDALLAPLSIGATISITESAVPEHRVVTELFERVRRAGERPIVVAERPYVVLSVLVDQVAGFVFRRGALLSHLGVILRERGCPAVVAAEPAIYEGDQVSLAGGHLTVAPVGPQPGP